MDAMTPQGNEVELDVGMASDESKPTNKKSIQANRVGQRQVAAHVSEEAQRLIHIFAIESRSTVRQVIRQALINHFTAEERPDIVRALGQLDH